MYVVPHPSSLLLPAMDTYGSELHKCPSIYWITKHRLGNCRKVQPSSEAQSRKGWMQIQMPVQMHRAIRLLDKFCATSFKTELMVFSRVFRHHMPDAGDMDMC